MAPNTRLFLIQKYFFYLLVLFLPTQFGKHFWPEFSYIHGIRSDYLSPTLYFTDVLILLLFATWFLTNIKTFQLLITNYQLRITWFKTKKRQNFWQIGLGILFLLIGILLSPAPFAGLYGLIKFFEMIFLGFFVSHYFSTIKNVKHELSTLSLLFSFSILFESFLAIVQFFKQSSLGGLLYFFGERAFTGSTPGIANVSLSGELFLRPYGTLPHPNVLAGFLIIFMTFVLFLYKEFEKTFFQKIILIALSCGTIALMITFSRIPIALWIAVVLVQVFKNTFTKTNMRYLALFLIAIVVFSFLLFSPLVNRFFETRIDEEAIASRIELMTASLKMIYVTPLLGVGLNNFLIRVPEYVETSQTGIYQPVHNIYLLIAAQCGIVVFLFVLLFIKKTLHQVWKMIMKTKHSFYRAVSVCILLFLIIGFFDHYLLTLQQGQLLVSLFLGLAFVKMKNNTV